MKIIVGSEGMGSWGKVVINKLLKKIGYTEIIYQNTDECTLIISSHFTSMENLWNNNPKKYIYFSGETLIPIKNNFENNNIYILTTIQNMNNYLYIPYVMYSPYLYKERKYTNINRKYILAYCFSNKIQKRENIFNIFVKKTKKSMCSAFGNCYGDYPECHKKIGGSWTSSELIDVYKDYKFVIAMENSYYDGYVTEKILNAFYSGAIPIYWGSSNINDFFNKKAFINVSDFNTLEECVDYAINLSDKEIKKMSQEPIYNNNDLINLFNDDYNKQHNNKILNEYLDKFKSFLN